MVKAAEEFVQRAGELDEVDAALMLCDEFKQRGDEGGADGGLGSEGEDYAGELSAESVVEDGEPDLLAELDEGGGAEIEGGEEQIDGEMIVEEAKAGETREVLRDGEFAGGRHAVEEDELHATKALQRRVR